MRLPTVVLVACTLLHSTAAQAQRRCRKGIPCGGSCIAATKTCRLAGGAAPAPSARRSPLMTARPAERTRSERHEQVMLGVESGAAIQYDGRVSAAGIRAKSGALYLLLDGAFPSHALTVIATAAATRGLPTPARLRGRRVRVTGRVALHYGIPELLVEQPEQVVVRP